MSTALMKLSTIPNIAVDVEIDAEIVQQAQHARASAEAIACIASQADYETAEKCLKDVTRLSNQIDNQRKGFVAPLNALAKSAKQVADAVRDPLEAAKERLKRTMGNYIAEERRKQEEALAKAVAEQEARERAAREEQERMKNSMFACALATTAPAPIPVVPPVTLEMQKPVETKGSAVIEKWLWSVEDEAAIPREFYILDTKKIDGLVRLHKGSLTIPGIRVFNETTVRSR
jgi:hypothetical protein